ncbi:periphilin-1-like [Astyanax mexicanus]|uniref:Periphilin-1-like n=1 Tax=Astyanax mexicanus TaxID=7994 RepID=A0A8T2LMZ9_ASTMX|nr:periphilin-1-like [Astyanax mexicanus]
MDQQKKDEKRPIKRMRSPTRFTRPFTRGRYFRPRFYYRARDDRFMRRPGFGLRLHRLHPLPRAPSLRLRARSRSPTLVLKHKVIQSSSPSPSQRSEKRSEKKSSSTTLREHKPNTPDHSRLSSAVSERPQMSFTVTQEGQVCSSRDSLSSVTRAAARNRAIQRKREEIEEVYRRDCDTFGVVVKMLVAKDPTLERSIQSSLRENLREIGLRCVEAMEQFIQEYDCREPGTLPVPQPH